MRDDLILIGYCFVLKVPFLDASRISKYLETGHFSWSPLPIPYLEDCPQGMHQDLMFIPRKGIRRGLTSRGKALVQLAALLPPGFRLRIKAFLDCPRSVDSVESLRYRSRSVKYGKVTTNFRPLGAIANS